jgi:transcriptional regulator with XRE-family HTH domain
MRMDIKNALAKAIRDTRKAKGLTQEDFSDVSSRTYLSSIERGIKNPTFEMINILAKRLGVHPLSLLTMAYLIENNDKSPDQLLDAVKNEVKGFS